MIIHYIFSIVHTQHTVGTCAISFVSSVLKWPMPHFLSLTCAPLLLLVLDFVLEFNAKVVTQFRAQSQLLVKSNCIRKSLCFWFSFITYVVCLSNVTLRFHFSGFRKSNIFICLSLFRLCFSPFASVAR